MSELFTDGLHLMILGMGVVFVFLTILVIATYLMSLLIRLTHQPEIEPASIGVSTVAVRHQEIAAVAAAVRAMHDKQSS